MSLWKRWFGGGPGADPDQGTPTLERTANATFPEDNFESIQHVLDAKEEYRAAAEFARPKTFVEKFRWMKTTGTVGITAGHLVSAVTMLGFAALASWRWTNVERDPSTINWGIFLVSLVSLLLVVFLIEKSKVKLEGQLFTALALGRAVRPGKICLVLFLVLLSVSFSGAGGYLGGLVYSDNSASIEANYSNQAAQLISTYRADSLAAENRFNSRLARDQGTVKDWKSRVSDLRGEKIPWKGKMVMPERNRKPANLLVNKIAEKEDEISRYTESHLEEMKALASGRTSSQSSLEGEKNTMLATDLNQAQRFAGISVIIVILVEILTLLSHFILTRYFRGVFREGKATNMIPEQFVKERISLEGIMAKFYRDQAQRLAGDLEEIQQVTGTPGPGSRPSAGYKSQSYQQQLQAELEEARKELEILRESSHGKTGKESPGGFDTFQREISLENSHPQFSKKLQPDQYRGIDERKYQRFLTKAQAQLQGTGRYNKSELARAAGISRPTVTKYFNRAFETNDLPR